MHNLFPSYTIEIMEETLDEANAELIRVQKYIIDYIAVVLRLGTTCLFLSASIFLSLDNFDWFSAGSLFLSGMLAYCLAVGIEVYKQYISPISNIGLFAGFSSMVSLMVLFAGGLVMRDNHQYSIQPSVPYLWIGGSSILFISQIVKGFVSFEHGPLKSFSFGSAACGTLCFLIASLFLINDFLIEKKDLFVVSVLCIIGSVFYLIHSILFLSATLFYEIYYDEGNMTTETDSDSTGFIEGVNCIVRIVFSILLIGGSFCLHPNARVAREHASPLLISGFAFFLIAVSVEVYKNRGRGSLMVGAHINSFVAIIFSLLGSILLFMYLPHDPDGEDSEVKQANEIYSIWIAGSLLLFLALLVESTAIFKDDPGQSGVRSGGSIAFTSLGALFYTIAFAFASGDLKKYNFTESLERNVGWLIAGGFFYLMHSLLYIFSFRAN